MTKVALHQGAYLARSPIANAQVCYNLYAESNPGDAPFPVTHYPAPGTELVTDFTGYGSVNPTDTLRGLYMTSSGVVVGVVGRVVFSWGLPSSVEIGYLASNSGLPVSMCDNGTTLVLVDGSANGYMVDLADLYTSDSLVHIDDPAFYGANRVDYIDTFMIFNQPGTNNFYTTTSGVVTPFDATYAASKEGWNDRLVTLAALHDNIWLFGDQTTEIWYNAGGTTFPFARMPNSILQQGCAAANSVVIADNAVYWVSQDRWGRNMVMRGEGYMAKRVSTFAIEDQWAAYSITSCVGMAYQLLGHEIIGFLFPDDNAWWGYDASTQMWHQRTYNGLSEAWLPYCMASFGSVPNVYGTSAIFAGSRLGPQLLQVATNQYTDYPSIPITRQRSWVHTQQDGNRIHHSRFSCSMAAAPMTPDTVNLDWSDDAGQTYGTAVPQTINNQTLGQYQWRRLGYARDRVYRLTWSGNGECALNGAYIEVIPQGR